VHPTEADLSRDERRREIAAILAAGILRLTTRREVMPEHSDCTPQSGAENLPHSPRKPLLSIWGHHT